MHDFTNGQLALYTVTIFSIGFVIAAAGFATLKNFQVERRNNLIKKLRRENQDHNDNAVNWRFPK